jgi:hypothetical protein
MKPLDLKTAGLVKATSIVMSTIFSVEFRINAVFSGQRENKVVFCKEPILDVMKGISHLQLISSFTF